MSRLRGAILSLVPLLVGGVVPANSPGTESRPVARISASSNLVGRLVEHYEKLAREQPELWVRFGTVANRKERWVRVWAQPIEINTSDPVEFLLIGPESGHDYEALARSYATACDIHRALEFIGLRPGSPVDYKRYRMWPKGERVRVWYRWSHRVEDYFTGNFTNQVRAEKLIRDTVRNSHMPLEDFVFVGSRWLSVGDETTSTVYAADAYDPQAIISDYNEPLTVLDVPYRAVDSEVYGSRTANPELLIPADCLLDILIGPAYTDQAPHLVDLVVEVHPAAERRQEPATLRYRILGQFGDRVTQGQTLADLLAVLDRLEAAQSDVFLQVRPDGAVEIEALRRLYVLLWGLTQKTRLRLEPPAGEDLFWKAFLPPARLLDVNQRVTQPWELYLGEATSGVTGYLVRVTEHWNDEDAGGAPRLSTNRYIVASGEDALQVTSTAEYDIPLLLVYCSPEMKYSLLLEFIRPLLPDHPTVYVVPHPVERRVPSE